MERLIIKREEHLTANVVAAAQYRISSRLTQVLPDNTTLCCCLGIYCRDLLSIDRVAQAGFLVPHQIPDIDQAPIRWLQADGDAADSAMLDELCGNTNFRDTVPAVLNLITHTNDAQALAPELRELLLSYFFLKYGKILLTFTGNRDIAANRAIGVR